MKVLEKGKGWSVEKACTGSGNGDGGCGAKLLVEESDLFQTMSQARDETDYYITFKCPDCGVLTDIRDKSVPSRLHGKLPSQKTWEQQQNNKPERKVSTGVALVIVNDAGEILMGQRKGSHGAGSWSVPGGWMRHGESFLDTAIREAREEADLEVLNVSLITATSTVFTDKDVHSVTALLWVPRGWWRGEPKAMEDDKLMDGWRWFRPTDLPTPLFQPLADMKYPPFSDVVSDLITPRDLLQKALLKG